VHGIEERNVGAGPGLTPSEREDVREAEAARRAERERAEAVRVEAERKAAFRADMSRRRRDFEELSGCGRLVTVSFGGGGRADGALAALGPEPECEPAASSAVANRASNFAPYCVECLSEQSFAVVDAFVGERLCAAVRQEVVRLDRERRLHHGLLGGGATGTAPTQTNGAMRGDRVGWFDGHEPQIGLRALPTYLQAVDALVGLVAGTLPELQALQVERRAPMVRVRAGSPPLVVD
jgi:hypothetical protein